MSKYPKIETLLSKQIGFNLDIHADFEKLKAAITKLHPTADFMAGQCMLFHIELRRAFPEARPLINNDHVVSLIGGTLWDFNGPVYFNETLEPKLIGDALARTEEFLNATS